MNSPLIADNFNINIDDVIHIANRHPRVNIHKPGIGVGGHCIPVDPYFLIEKQNYKTSIIKTSRELNLEKEYFIFKKIKNLISQRNKINNIYFYGLTYKPNINDFRESPAIRILQMTSKLESNKYICAIDPFLNKEYEKDNIFYKKNEDFKNDSLIFVLTPHSKFENLFTDKDLKTKNIEIFYMST